MCRRWLQHGLACPFQMGGAEQEEGEPPDDVPPIGVPTGSPPALLLAARRGVVGDVLAQAEEVVAAAAEAIPVGVGKDVLSLAEHLRERGPVAVGVSVAAGLALRAVANRISRGGFGGFSFPSVFDPARALRAP